MSLSSSCSSTASESSVSSEQSDGSSPCPITPISIGSSTSTSPILLSPSTMDVCLINVHGRNNVLTVERSSTVEKLKKDYGALFGTTSYVWYMMYGGKYLHNQNKLTDYKIQDGSIIYVTNRLAFQLNNPIALYITDLTDNNTCVLIYADQDWTVQRVKKEYGQQKSNEHLNCRLYYRGCVLQEKRTLAEYNLSGEVVIHSVLSSTPATQVGLQSLKKCILRKKSCKFL